MYTTVVLPWSKGTGFLCWCYSVNGMVCLWARGEVNPVWSRAILQKPRVPGSCQQPVLNQDGVQEHPRHPPLQHIHSLSILKPLRSQHLRDGFTLEEHPWIFYSHFIGLDPYGGLSKNRKGLCFIQ